MKTECTACQLEFHGLGRRAVVGQFDGGKISSDSGGLLLREVEQRTHILKRLAGCFEDYRDPDQVEHRVESLIKQRVMGLALGYEDLNDHEALRQDSNIHVLPLTNDRATREDILKAKNLLMQSRVHDLVIVFAAGHGMTDEAGNYYLGTFDIDADAPDGNGLPYEEFEFLLDGIPALKKVLLLDTCFSGEIEDDAPVLLKETQPDVKRTGQVVMRAFKPIRGISLVPDSGSEGTVERLSPDVIRFHQDWFADLRRGTGAAVIASSSGNEYSLEGPQWGNGVFTYALLQGLKNRLADTNADQKITVTEIQSFVIDQVRELTQGGQNPTIRHQNLESDFAIH